FAAFAQRGKDDRFPGATREQAGSRHRQNHPQRIHASQLHGDESEPFFPAGLSVARAPSPAKGRRLIILRREKELRAQLSQPSVTAEEPQNLSAGSSHISIES